VRNPNLDSLSLQRPAAAGVLSEINKLLAEKKYDPAELVDWYIKLGRIAEGYTSFEHPRVSPIEREDRNDYDVEVHADLSRLNAEQLIALKRLALIASATVTDAVISVIFAAKGVPATGPPQLADLAGESAAASRARTRLPRCKKLARYRSSLPP
jgi:hypothetical protein